MDSLENALRELDKAIKTCDTVQSVEVKIVLKKPSQSKAKPNPGK